MSKIIKLKEIPFVSLQAGGGSPIYKEPTNIDKLIGLRKTFMNTELFLGSKIYVLTHDSRDKNGSPLPIPAPSSRFVDSLKVIFGSNSFTYEATRYNKTYEKLEFIYLVSYEDIARAISRINHIINLVNEFKNPAESIENFYKRITETDKQIFQEKISEYKTTHDLKIFSFSGIVELLSSQQYLLLNFRMVDDIIKNNDGDEHHIKFVSIEKKQQALQILNNSNVKTTYQSEDEISFVGSFNGSLGGIQFDETLKKKAYALEKYSPLERGIISQFNLREEEKNNIIVGVIDGGIKSNSIILPFIEYYDATYFGFEEKPQIELHAESVTSILLWNNKLNPSMSDNGTSPDIALFNVMSQDDNIGDVMKKIELILKRFSHRIKIWNFSWVVEGIKAEDEVSTLCVFLDRMQATYKVLFIVSTGNYEGNNGVEINAPSGSFRAISVSSVKKNGEPASYSKIGGSLFLNLKPDLSIWGGDEGEEMYALSDNFKSKTFGTSFATPLVTRKVAQLFSAGHSLNSIPAILSTYARYNFYKRGPKNLSSTEVFELKKLIGHGFLPVDSQEMLNLIGNKAMIVIDQTINNSYSQGFFAINMPKYNGKFDQQIFCGINIDGELEKNPTYEYVKDCTRITFAKVDPFSETKLLGSMIINSPEGMDETALRIYKGKFKTRDTFEDTIIRPRLGFAKKQGAQLEISSWGIKIVRNIIGVNRQSKSDQQISFCIIIDCLENNNFYNEFIAMNQAIVHDTNINIDVEDINNNLDIQFI